jgi:hypothetical protein
MSKALVALTVPGEWWDTSVDIPPFEKIVGLVAPEQEILLPDRAKDYWYGGGYRDGYSKHDIAERPLALSDTGNKQLVVFFERFLMQMGWRDVGRLSERYDCHWLAHWVKGKITEEVTIDYTLDAAEQVILQSNKCDKPLCSEQIGVIGGLCLSQAEPYAEACHSFIALDVTNALQATGMHGAIAIASQADTLKYYREASWASLRIEKAGIGVFTATQN